MAGIDASVGGDIVTAAIVVLSYPALELLDVSISRQQLAFPYIPGLLSFREAPAILAAAEALSTEPDLVIVDGHAIAHPRRFGLGAHIGLLFDKPTFGCAKSRLIGHHEAVGDRPGDLQYLFDAGEIIGAVVRTKSSANPIYVSVGHKLTLAAAVGYLFATCRGFRLPEPIRRAHGAAGGKLAVPLNGRALD